MSNVSQIVEQYNAVEDQQMERLKEIYAMMRTQRGAHRGSRGIGFEAGLHGWGPDALDNESPDHQDRAFERLRRKIVSVIEAEDG